MLKIWPILYHTVKLPDKKPQSAMYSSKLTTCFIIYSANHRKKNHYRPIILYYQEIQHILYIFFNFKKMLFVFCQEIEETDASQPIYSLKWTCVLGKSKWIKHKHPNQQAGWPYIKALHWFLKSKLHSDHVTIWKSNNKVVSVDFIWVLKNLSEDRWDHKSF